MTWDWAPHVNRADYESVFHEYRVVILRAPGLDRPAERTAYRCQILGRDPHRYLESWPMAADALEEAQAKAEMLVERWYARRVAARLMDGTPLPDAHGTWWEWEWE